MDTRDAKEQAPLDLPIPIWATGAIDLGRRFLGFKRAGPAARLAAGFGA